jgi:hypothetical protein
MFLALAVFLAVPAECRTPPSRTSSAYWSFIEACGCSGLEAPSRASSDYDRYLKACSQWRERNPYLAAAPSPRPSPSPTAGPQPSPAATPAAPVPATPVSRECATPPSRTSGAYWGFIEACGCASLEAPSRASSDYDRYEKACAQWRERNPYLAAPAPQPSPE